MLVRQENKVLRQSSMGRLVLRIVALLIIWATVTFTASYLTHAYDIRHDLCGHFRLVLPGLIDDVPLYQQPEE